MISSRPRGGPIRRRRRSGLGDARITSDVKHVEIGLTDISDSTRYASRELSARGITGQLVLVGGDELGAIAGVAGSDSLMLVDEDERCFLRLPGSSASERVAESQGSLSSGCAAIRGSREEDGARSRPPLRRRRRLRPRPEPPGRPTWTHIDVEASAPPPADRRLLDLRADVLGRLAEGPPGLT